MDDRIAEIAHLRDDPTAPGAGELLRKALRASAGALVATAVAVVREHELTELAGELAPAFERLLERPIKRDPGCRGKAAVARALHDLEIWDDTVFERGLRYRQLEPVWGGREDTAAELRGICGYAFAHSARSDRISAVAELLADPERQARAAAARALGDAGDPAAEPLLRFKLLVGDDDPEVVEACFASLFHVATDPLPFVARFLDGDQAAGAQAALAIGQSRPDGALPLLVGWCRADPLGGRDEVGYLAIAMLRTDDATAFLIDRIADPEVPDRAAHAVLALATFRHDPALRERVDRAAASAHPEVRALIADRFDD
jgi:hypothetical protein